MRALVKSPAPAVLAASAAEWTERFIASGQATRPWAHEDIKQALAAETDEKCAYCEGRMLAVSFGDIEHIQPKSVFPRLVVSWDNLTLACSKCNQNKSSKYDEALPFVNPYVDEVEQHLAFFGTVVVGVSDRGVYSAKELSLNDPARVEARQRALDSLELLIRRYESADTNYTRDSLRELIEYQVSRGEYTAMCRTYLAIRKASWSADSVEV